jgi:hypothetical protein
LIDDQIVLSLCNLSFVVAGHGLDDAAEQNLLSDEPRHVEFSLNATGCNLAQSVVML